MKLINVNQISCIYIYKKTPSVSIQWFPEEKKFFGLIKYKEGFWTTSENLFGKGLVKEEYISESRIEGYDDYIVEGRICYKKPYIRVITAGAYDELYFFNTDEDMKEYLNKPELKDIKFMEM
jgi:hypothetical protein